MFFFLSLAWDNEKLLSPCEEEILSPHDNLHVSTNQGKGRNKKLAVIPKEIYVIILGGTLL